MKDGDIVTRNGNYFIVRKTADSHYYVALLLGGARVQAWHRISLKKLKAFYTLVENYDKEGLEL